MRVFENDRSVPGTVWTRRSEKPGGFTFARSEYETLLELAEGAYPREACGLMLGTHEDGFITVHSVQPTRNLATADDHFDLDPGDIVRLDRTARERNQQIVAVWHSHPDADGKPSREDLLGQWGGVAQVIVSVWDGGAGEVWVWS